jgi:diguanylate cyclase (GGDEF)-like protein
VQGLNISYREQKLSHLTISIGVATLAETDSDAEMLLRRADKALYAAKQGGRNQVKSAQENITV